MKKLTLRTFLLLVALLISPVLATPVLARRDDVYATTKRTTTTKKKRTTTTKKKTKVVIDTRAENIRLGTQEKVAQKAKKAKKASAQTRGTSGKSKATKSRKKTATSTKIDTSGEDVRFNNQNRQATTTTGKIDTSGENVRLNSQNNQATATTRRIDTSGENIRLNTQNRTAEEEKARREAIQKRAADNRAEAVRLKNQEAAAQAKIVERAAEVARTAADTRAEDNRIGNQEQTAQENIERRKEELEAIANDTRAENVRLGNQEKQEQLERTAADTRAEDLRFGNQEEAAQKAEGNPIANGFWTAIDAVGGVTRALPHAVGLWWNKTTRLGNNEDLAEEEIKAAEAIISSFEARLAKGEKLSPGDAQMLQTAYKLLGEDREILESPATQAWREVGPNSDPIAYADKYLNNANNSIIPKIVSDNRVVGGIAVFALLDASNLVGGGVSKAPALLKRVGAVAEIIDITGDAAKTAATLKKVDQAVDLAKAGNTVAVTVKNTTVPRRLFGWLPGVNKYKEEVFYVTKENADNFSTVARGGATNVNEIARGIAKNQGESAASILRAQDKIVGNLAKEAVPTLSKNVDAAKEGIEIATKVGSSDDVAKAKKLYRQTVGEYLDVLAETKSNPITKMPVNLRRVGNTAVGATETIVNTIGKPVERAVNVFNHTPIALVEPITTNPGIRNIRNSFAKFIEDEGGFVQIGRNYERETLPDVLPIFDSGDDLVEYLKKTKTISTSNGTILAGGDMANAAEKILQKASKGLYNNNPAALSSDLTRVTRTGGLRNAVEGAVTKIIKGGPGAADGKVNDILRAAEEKSPLASKNFTKPARARNTPDRTFIDNDGKVIVGFGSYGGSWFYPLLKDGAIAGDFKLHIPTDSAMDLHNLQTEVIPWLMENKVHGFKTMDPNNLVTGIGPVDPFGVKPTGVGQNSKAFTIYFERSEDAVAVGKKLDDFLSERGLNRINKIEDGNSGSFIGNSNRVLLTRDYMPGVLDEVASNPGANVARVKIDPVAATKILEKYAGGAANKGLLDAGVKPGSLIKQGDSLYLSIDNYDPNASKHFQKGTDARNPLKYDRAYIPEPARVVLSNLYQWVGEDFVLTGLGSTQQLNALSAGSAANLSLVAQKTSSSSGGKLKEFLEIAKETLEEGSGLPTTAASSAILKAKWEAIAEYLKEETTTLLFKQAQLETSIISARALGDMEKVSQLSEELRSVKKTVREFKTEKIVTNVEYGVQYFASKLHESWFGRLFLGTAPNAEEE